MIVILSLLSEPTVAIPVPPSIAIEPEEGSTLVPSSKESAVKSVTVPPAAESVKIPADAVPVLVTVTVDPSPMISNTPSMTAEPEEVLLRVSFPPVPEVAAVVFKS